MGKKWADVDEDDDEEEGLDPDAEKSGTRFESAVDKDGIKTVVEYTEKNGQTYKVTQKVKVTKVVTRTNQAIMARKSMAKFGLSAQKEDGTLVVKSSEEIGIELSKKPGAVAVIKDDAEEKFYEESLAVTESLFKEKKAWSTLNKEKQEEKEADTAAEKPPEPVAEAAAPATNPNAPGRYVPPSLRGKGTDGKGGKGDSKGGDQGQDASLRVTNLSEDVREGDLQDLFSQCGRLQRVYLAKDMTTMQSRGFAFITYYTKEDAQRAIDKLNGHGYDNLILQVQFAKPRT